MISIRLMKDSDKALIYRGLSETNWQDIPEDQKEVINRDECAKNIINDFERYLKEPRYKFKVFVAVTEDNNPIGYISIGETVNPAVGLPYGAIFDLWVIPEYRGKEIGKKLLDYALEQIRVLGYSHASILVSSSNLKAMELYKKRNFYTDRIFLVKKMK